MPLFILIIQNILHAPTIHPIPQCCFIVWRWCCHLKPGSFSPVPWLLVLIIFFLTRNSCLDWGARVENDQRAINVPSVWKLLYRAQSRSWMSNLWIWIFLKVSVKEEINIWAKTPTVISLNDSPSKNWPEDLVVWTVRKGWGERRGNRKWLLWQLADSDGDTGKGDLLGKERESWWGQVEKQGFFWWLHHSSWPELILRNQNLSGTSVLLGNGGMIPSVQQIQGHWERLSMYETWELRKGVVLISTRGLVSVWRQLWVRLICCDPFPSTCPGLDTGDLVLRLHCK